MQNFAVSDYNDGELTIDGADGILGIGPDKLSIYNNPDSMVVPTLVTTMFEQGIIDHNVFSVYFQPVSKTVNGLREQKRVNGEIVFGGGNYILFYYELQLITWHAIFLVEDRHITSNVSYVPTTKKPDFEVSYGEGS